METLKSRLQSLFSSWTVRIILGLLTLVGLGLLIFFWPHNVAVLGLRTWSGQAGATPIDCMIKDTNDNGYISCSALLKEEVVPLECGADVFNVGCRVNYGSAPPQVRSKVG